MADPPTPAWMDHITESWARSYPEQDVSMLPAMVRISRLGMLGEAFHRETLEAFELQPSDYSVLAALRRQGPERALSPSALYYTLERSSGGMTKMLRRLGDRGLVERVPDPDDGRASHVRMTAAGRKLEREIFELSLTRSRALLADLSASEVAEADASLKRLLGCLERHFYR